MTEMIGGSTAGDWVHIGPGADEWICIGGSTAGAARIDWWTNAGPLDDDQEWPLRPATRAEVEALQEPNACYAVLSCDGLKVRSSAIPVAGGVTVRLWSVGPWEAAVYTVQATEYASVLREVETRLAEIAEQRAQ